MRLSDAIAMGRMLIRHVAGTIDDGNGGGCAFGMAFRAIGDFNYFHHWDWKDQGLLPYPCDCKADSLIMGSACQLFLHEGESRPAQIIVHLFNFHVMTAKDWTLDQLIDWVRTNEPAEAETEAVTAVAPDFVEA